MGGDMENDWSEISDAALRKRIQNRLAQRKHRRKLREQATSQADTSPPTASATTYNTQHPSDGGSFLPPVYVPMTEGGPNSTFRFHKDFDTSTMEDTTSDFFAMHGFPTNTRPTWDLNSRNDSTSDALVGTSPKDRAGPGPPQSSPRPDTSSAVRQGFGSPSLWGASQQLANDIQPHAGRHNQQHTASPVTVLPQSTSSWLPRRRHCQSERCTDFSAPAPISHRCHASFVDDARADGHRCSDRPSSVASSSTHQHVSPSSSPMDHAARSEMPQDLDIDLDRILSQIELERRILTSVQSRHAPKAQSQPLPAENVPSHNNRRSLSYREHFDHPLGFETTRGSSDVELAERLGPKVRKVVVIYMDDSDQE